MEQSDVSDGYQLRFDAEKEAQVVASRARLGIEEFPEVGNEMESNKQEEETKIKLVVVNR